MKNNGCDEYSSKICQTSPQIIFTLKILAPKSCDQEKHFWPKRWFLPKLYFVAKFFFAQNFFQAQIFFRPTLFGSQIFLGPKFFSYWKNFQTPNFFGPKIFFQTQKLFHTPNFFRAQNFFGLKNFFGTQKSFDAMVDLIIVIVKSLPLLLRRMKKHLSSAKVFMRCRKLSKLDLVIKAIWLNMKKTRARRSQMRQSESFEQHKFIFVYSAINFRVTGSYYTYHQDALASAGLC